MDKDPIALHVLVVGFHHKRGMQVEYAYPPFDDGKEGYELPEKWRHLPSLCLPDGAHNHEADTVYFHLPHLYQDTQTVFGISCYRQIDADKVTNKTADITRNTVQKSVCVLTTIPIYGYIQERLKVTTKVYFKEADFNDVKDLEGLFHDLNNVNWKDRLMHVDLEDKYGICVSEAVHIFGRNILVLFKLFLLEKKVLFFSGPVAPLVRVLISLLALLPENIPEGVAQAAATRCRGSPCLEAAHQQFFPQECHINSTQSVSSYILPESNECDDSEAMKVSVEKLLEVSNSLEEIPQEFERTQSLTSDKEITDGISPVKEDNDETTKIINDIAEKGINPEIDDGSDRRSSVSSLTSITSRGSIMSPLSAPLEGLGSHTNLGSKISSLKGRLSGAFNYWTGRDKSPPNERPLSTTTPSASPSEPAIDDTPRSSCGVLPADVAEELFSEANAGQQPCSISAEKYALLDAAACGLPLHLFTKGNLLHPYLSLQYLDVLTAPSTRAFIVGASNMLFVHKKDLYDVVVQIEDGKIEASDPSLKKQLNLSIEDLRFAENIVRQVEAVNASIGDCGTSHLADVFLDGVGWIGGEEWLRHQFKVYILSMLRSSLCPDVSREYEIFNSSFISAWKGTHNYRMWLAGGPYETLMELPPGHPNAGTMSMTDMRIRLSHTIQSLDRGRRLNQTIVSTGTAVVKTKEVVGGAITSARGALTNFWSSVTAGASNTERKSSSEVETAMEATVEDDSEELALLGIVGDILGTV